MHAKSSEHKDVVSGEFEGRSLQVEGWGGRGGGGRINFYVLTLQGGIMYPSSVHLGGTGEHCKPSPHRGLGPYPRNIFPCMENRRLTAQSKYSYSRCIVPHIGEL